MKRVLLSALVLFGFIPTVTADHITGGEVYYIFRGMSNGAYNYAVTVKLFMRCFSGRQFNNPTFISIFDRASTVRISNLSVPLSHSETITLTDADPCITNPPTVCYEVGYYEFNVSLPGSSNGYLIAAQVMYRVDGIRNLTNSYDRVGATYTGEIPATSRVSNAAENHSAKFTGSDLVVVCSGNSFSYSFAASDGDKDQLRYSFCNAYQTTGADFGGNNNQPPPPPPYSSVPYGNGFNESMPLGKDVRIDPNTGMITGIAPEEGIYVVTVCVEEIRQGVVIATQRKDIQINVAYCSIAAAALPEEYMLCRDSRTLNAENLSTSPLISSYNWEVANEKGASVFSSTGIHLTHTFADTGTYSVKLVINRKQVCADSTTALVRVYPGEVPDFTVSGPCIIRQTQFTDATTYVYGAIRAWNWNFGDDATANDFSTQRNPAYHYATTGNKNVSLFTENTNGCKDTISKTVSIFEKPPIQLAFRDTLICPPDNLQLQATGTGIFSWTPDLGPSGHDGSSPRVSPTTTTTYYVQVDDAGCINNDSVRIRVTDRVTLQMAANTSICEGDSLRLDVVSNGLRYSWTPAGTLDNPFAGNPVARPVSTTTYAVTASVSSCMASGQITVTPVPYPLSDAGPDTTICHNTTAQLQARTDGSRFVWAPAASLRQTNSLNPLARPLQTTSYIFYAYDNKGCEKPGVDSVTVYVRPDIVAFAGRDTSVVVGQPLQLQASGGARYEWSPPTSLSAVDIPNPVAVFRSSASEGSYPLKVLVYDENGCVDSAYMQVRVFSTLPSIFVPSAFTPNGDGRNDVFELVAAGIQRVDIFQVYNRWGQLVYSSPGLKGSGWDGRYNGKLLTTGTFVWVVKAVDYTGTPLFRKGTVTLIR